MRFLEPLVKLRQLNIAVGIDDYDEIAMVIITRIQLLDGNIVAENRRLSASNKNSYHPASGERKIGLTFLPRVVRISHIAAIDPHASPSGRVCDVSKTFFALFINPTAFLNCSALTIKTPFSKNFIHRSEPVLIYSPHCTRVSLDKRHQIANTISCNA